jgi:tetrapyrrole methylase family protein / MazG family protein
MDQEVKMKAKVIVVGLGFGDADSLSIGTWRLLKEKQAIFLRTEKHPVAEWLKEQRISFVSFDEVYERHASFAPVYEEIAERLLEEAQRQREIVYAVPGHPMVAEKTVQLLKERGAKRGVEVEVSGGQSFLEIAFSRLGIDPIEGFLLLDGTDLQPSRIRPDLHLLIAQVYDRMVASEVKLSLMEVYPDDTPVFLATALGISGEEKILKLPLYELDRQEVYSNLTAVYVPPVKEEKVFYRRFDYLTGIIEKLRSPEGCPWDREQTHESLRPYLLEETYELLDALNEGDPEAMLEELGDLLLQILLHAQIAKEEGTFDIAEVIETLSTKMIRRHPHVFGDVKVDSAEQVVENWSKIKQREKGEKKQSILDGIPKSYPAMLRAYAQQKKAEKVGFDWGDVSGVHEKVLEELEELKKANSPEEREKELGDLLYTVISLARFYKIDPESALERACRKFYQRFTYLEKRAKELGKPLEEIDMGLLDQWWEEAKKKEFSDPDQNW